MLEKMHLQRKAMMWYTLPLIFTCDNIYCQPTSVILTIVLSNMTKSLIMICFARYGLVTSHI